MASAMRSIRALKRALALPSGERRDAFVAAVLLGYANLALKLLPFSRAIALGSVATASDRGDAVRGTVRAVRRASYAVPWRTLAVTKAEIDPAEVNERHRRDQRNRDQ